MDMDIVGKPAAPTQPNEPTPIVKPEPRADIGTPLVAWLAPEYDFIPKSHQWYWVVGIMTAALVVVAALIRNLLFGILTVLAGFTIALYGARRPKIVRFAI